MSVLKDSNGEYTTSPDGDPPTMEQVVVYELQTAQAADAAKQAYQKEMNATPVVAPTSEENK